MSRLHRPIASFEASLREAPQDALIPRCSPKGSLEGRITPIQLRVPLRD
jgi:hypothetical protein